MRETVKKLTRGITLILIAICIILAGSAFHVLWHYQSTADTERDCAVVFGAAVWRDDVPSHALHDRTMMAATLYDDKRISCIVLSGGASTFGAHEVDVMKKILLTEGVPANILVEDRNGTNTGATLSHLDPTRSYVLISNDFHLSRIKFLAHRANLQHFDLQASKYLHGRYPKEPYFFFRETIATIYYLFRLDSFFEKPQDLQDLLTPEI